MHHSHLLSSLKANKCVLCVPRMLKGKVWEAAVKATVLIVIWQNGDLPLSPSATENGEESRKCETVPVFPDPTMFSSNFHHHPFDNNQLIAFKLKISTSTLWVSLWCNAVSWKVIICLSYQKADLHSSKYLRRQNNKKRPAEKLFSVSLTFVNATKKIKGIPLWVCTLMSLAAVSIYHSLYYCVASCQRNCQLTLFCSPFERRNK